MMTNREIDALVAEKVMGWAIHRRNTAWWVHKDDVDIVTWRKTANVHEWQPHRRIEQAWQVYEWLESRGLVRVCNGDGDSKDCDFTPLQTRNHPSGEYCLESAHGSAESYPMAICLAALKAVGVEVAD
jgi:hypothetical protein